VYVNNIKIDKYTNTPLFVYKVEENPKNLDIIIEYSDNSDMLINQLNNIKGVKTVITNLPHSKNPNPYLRLTDTFTYLYKYPNYKVLTVTKDPKYCLFIKPKDHTTNEPLKDVINNNMTIGYINDLDAKFIKYICISHGIDIKLLKLKKVSIPKLINDKFFSDQGIYTMMLFISLTNNKFIESIDNNFQMDFLNYENFDINKIKFLVPFVKIMNIDLSIPFIHYKNDFSIKTCFAFDFLLCGTSEIENDKDLGLKFNKLIVRFENFESINYYSAFFSFFKQTIEYLNISNNHITNRDNLPILEQFIEYKNVTFDIIPQDNINGFYNYDDQSMILDFTIINGIPLTLHSRITLNEQERIEENGNYFVKYQSDDSRENLLNGGKTIIQKYLIYDGPINNMTDYMININKVTDIEGIRIIDIRSTDEIKIDKINKFANLVKIKGVYYLKIKKSISENETYDPRFECIDDPLIKSKGLCESDYDPIGKPKFKKQYWDRRCEKNEDCPFYMANKNYKNYHGGCDDGWCQLPIGMKAVSYRKYDNDYKPLCYNCKDNDDPNCCEEQKNRRKYPDLVTPDYAFPLDVYERMNEIKENDSTIKWFNY